MFRNSSADETRDIETLTKAYHRYKREYVKHIYFDPWGGENLSKYLHTWNLSKILHRRIFRLEILHRQFHLILTVLVRENTKNEWKWRNLHRWQKFYTAAGTDGMDKFHLCEEVVEVIW